VKNQTASLYHLRRMIGSVGLQMGTMGKMISRMSMRMRMVLQKTAGGKFIRAKNKVVEFAVRNNLLATKTSDLKIAIFYFVRFITVS